MTPWQAGAVAGLLGLAGLVGFARCCEVLPRLGLVPAAVLAAGQPHRRGARSTRSAEPAFWDGAAATPCRPGRIGLAHRGRGRDRASACSSARCRCCAS